MYIIFFAFRHTAPQRTRSSGKNGKPHNTNLRTLGVLYPVLVVEGQGAHPEPQGLGSRYGCVVQMWGSATPGRPLL